MLGVAFPRFQRLALELLRHAPRSHGHRRLAVPVVHLLFQQLVLLLQLLNGFQLPAVFLVDFCTLICYTTIGNELDVSSKATKVIRCTY